MISMSIQQNPLKKMCAYGDITIYFLGGTSVTLQNVLNPGKCMECIQELASKGYFIDK
jgi:hypothetical protein